MPDLFLFVLFDSLHPLNNLSVIKGRVFLGWTSAKLGLMFLLKDTTQWRRWGANPRPPRSRVKHSTTEPLRSQNPPEAATQKEEQKFAFKTDYPLKQDKSIGKCSKRAFWNTLDLH